MKEFLGDLIDDKDLENMIDDGMLGEDDGGFDLTKDHVFEPLDFESGRPSALSMLHKDEGVKDSNPFPLGFDLKPMQQSTEESKQGDGMEFADLLKPCSPVK